MKALNGIIAAATVVTLAACGPAASMAGPGAPGTTRQAEPTTVRVQNNNWLDMVVYVVNGTSRIRLGTVTALGSETFALPRSAMGASGQVRLFADPIGSNRGYMTDVLHVRPGQRVALDVGHNISISFVSVWN